MNERPAIITAPSEGPGHGRNHLAVVEPDEIVELVARRSGAAISEVRRIDTHAASIFLAGDRAWKLKRPVRLPYLDFSTPERRRNALDAELHLNRRTAPELYLAVHAVTRDAAGKLRFGGGGRPVDYVLEMHRFGDRALLVDRIDHPGIDPRVIDRLAEAIVAFHRDAEVNRRGSGRARLDRVIAGNATSFAAYPQICVPSAVADLIVRQRAALARNAALLDARARKGRVRHCHGDLHLANIALIKGEPVPFDCLEFDATLATTDTLYDLAFLVMDLWCRGQHDHANRLVNRYLDLSAPDEEGVRLMPLFLSVRAAVRAHIAATRAADTRLEEDVDEARRLLDCAGAMLDMVPPRLIAIGGRSGTGKSTLARALGPAIGAAPGARILRTDVLRKRMAGVMPETRLPRTAYTTASSAEVYASLLATAEKHLSDGTCVIADAAFLTPEERESIRMVAHNAGAGFAGLWLELSLTGRLARVSARARDASDAGAAVVRLQSRQPVGALDHWRRVRASGALGVLARKARHILGLT